MIESLDLTTMKNETWLKSVTPGDHLEVTFRVNTGGLFTMKSVIKRLKRNPAVDTVNSSSKRLRPRSTLQIKHKLLRYKLKVLSVLSLLFGALAIPFFISKFYMNREGEHGDFTPPPLVGIGALSGVVAFVFMLLSTCFLMGSLSGMSLWKGIVFLSALFTIGAALGWMGTKVLTFVD